MISYCSVNQLSKRLNEAAGVSDHWLPNATAECYAATYGPSQRVGGGNDAPVLRVYDFGVAVLGSIIHGFASNRQDELRTIETLGKKYHEAAGQIILTSASTLSIDDVRIGDMIWGARAAMASYPGGYFTQEQLMDDNTWIGPAWEKVIRDDYQNGHMAETDSSKAFERLRIKYFVWEGMGDDAEKYCFRPAAFCNEGFNVLVHSATTDSLWKE